jgi:hypothetical protein
MFCYFGERILYFGVVMMMRFLALVGVIAAITNVVFADVVITRLEPLFPVVVPWENLPDPLIQPIDFNHDGQPDLYFFYDNVSMSSSFFAPSQVFIVPTPPPTGHTNIYGAVAALPFGTVIGSNVVSSLDVSNYLWWGGDPVTDGDTQYGDHGNDVGYVVGNDIEGMPPSVVGDVVGKEGVMAFKFYINGQPHFGYVDFDFRYLYSIPEGYGFGGFIIGYAYETEPGVPITAEKLNDFTPTGNNDGLITDFNRVNGYVLTWKAVNGSLYRVQSSTNLVDWTDASPDIQADGNQITYVVPVPSGSQCFYRIYRVY